MTSLVRMTDPSAPDATDATGRGWVALLDHAIELAKFIGGTEFVPRAMRNNPAVITATILYGDEVGFGPMQSLNSVVMIEGRPSLYAKAQRALVLAAGHAVWPEELNTTRCTWAGRRRGETEITRVTWTMEDARRANLAGRQNYRNYPRQMLSARASAELCGAIFGDVIAGLPSYEELDDGGGDIGAESSGNSGAATGGTTRRRRGKAAGGVTAIPQAVDPPPGEPAAASLPPLPGDELTPDDANTQPVTHPEQGDSRLSADPVEGVEEPPRMMTDAQRRRMHALFTARGVTDRGDRLRYTSAVIGRVIVSAKELTAVEADALLTALELDATPEGEPVPEPPELEEPPLPLDEQT